MSKMTVVRGIAAFFLIIVVGWGTGWGAGEEAAASLDAKALLEKAENLILPWQAGTVDVTMSYKMRNQPARQTFKVYLDGARALVVFQSPADQIGNLILLIDNDMWYYKKNTRQAVKVPELHKTTGQLPCADIPRLIWAKDYDAKVVEKSDFTIGTESVPSIKLEIDAVARGLTYKHGEVWLHEKTLHPIQMNLHFRSGKCARKVKFMEFTTVLDKTVVHEIKIIDFLHLGKAFILQYDNFVPEKPPERFFSESALPFLSKELAPWGRLKDQESTEIPGKHIAHESTPGNADERE